MNGVDGEQTQIYLIIAIAIVAMLIMAGSIVVFVVFYQKKMIQEQLKRQAIEYEYQQRMMQAQLESQEAERRRLAADLHDSIGGMLSAIRVGIISLGRSLPDPKAVNETKDMLDETISTVRRISRDLLPATLEKFGVVHAIREMCERFQATSSIAIRFTEGSDLPTLEPQKELMIFRVAQELLNNAIKHAEAANIHVTLEFNSALRLTVEDDGVGFDVGAHKNDKPFAKGLGLFNIENRARLIGADVNFQKALPKGAKITLTLPLEHEEGTKDLPGR